MLTEALVGAAIGAGFAAFLWAMALTGLDRLNQGLLTSAGLVALIAVCLALDGWIVTALAGFVAAAAAGAALHARLR